MHKNYVIVITGATATGKSDMALGVAQEVGGEIINADIGSWYTPLTIGTAKPDWKKETIVHHMFDILDEPKQFTVVQFRDRVLLLIEEIWARGHVPIIVGGSAFYIKGLWYKQHTNTVEGYDEARYVDVPTLELWNQLETIDTQRAARIHPHDRYRVVRALQLYHATSKKPSEFEPVYDPVAPMYVIFCERDRQELYERIDKRVLIMLQQGWVDEVRSLRATPWEDFLLHKKIIGYDDIILYLQQQQLQNDYDDAQYDLMVQIIQQKTRNYAKRQITFLHKLHKDILERYKDGQYAQCIESVNLTLCDVGLYINGLSSRLFKIFGKI